MSVKIDVSVATGVTVTRKLSRIDSKKLFSISIRISSLQKKRESSFLDVY